MNMKATKNLLLDAMPLVIEEIKKMNVPLPSEQDFEDDWGACFGIFKDGFKTGDDWRMFKVHRTIWWYGPEKLSPFVRQWEKKADKYLFDLV